ncbi:MAG: glycosyltransferase family 4 protein [Gammaproteobacteria bacterium]|nr:glycosyltransferase family 4 protein [Gammaproteobacteria bacterium]
MSTGRGGLELYAVRTASQLMARQVEALAVVAKHTFTADRMREQAVVTIALPKANRYLPLWAAKRLARIIDTQQIDILHMHWAKDLALAVLAKRWAKRRVKLVYTRQMMLTRDKHDPYHRFMYRHVDLFLTITRELADLAQDFLPMPKDRIKTLYYGVEQPPRLTPQQRAELRAALRIPTDRFALGMVGRIEAHKGQQVVVEALKQLMNQGVVLHLTLIGPAMRSDFEAKLKQGISEARLTPYISFYGSHPNPIEIMSAFDALVLATRKETFGLVLIEAMRNGVAVVGTNAGGVVEIIEDGITGLLFEPGNAVQLAEKLLLLMLNKPLAQALAAAGKTKADRLFAQETHYDQLLAWMNGLINIGRYSR